MLGRTSLTMFLGTEIVRTGSSAEERPVSGETMRSDVFGPTHPPQPKLSKTADSLSHTHSAELIRKGIFQ